MVADGVADRGRSEEARIRVPGASDRWRVSVLALAHDVRRYARKRYRACGGKARSLYGDMIAMGRMQREKGKRGERECAAELNRILGDDANARRGVQFQGGNDSPDVRLDLPIHVEVKRCEAINIYAAMEQAKKDAPDGVPAVVCHRKNGRQWLAIVEIDSLADVAQIVAKHIAARK